MRTQGDGESSVLVGARVARARKVQAKRFRRSRHDHNAFMRPAQIARHCVLDESGRRILQEAMDRLGLSARGFHRVVKVVRTIADLAGAEAIEPAHLQEAIFTAFLFGLWLETVVSAQEPRRVVRASPPEYPELMHLAGIQGKFVVALTVSPSGE